MSVNSTTSSNSSLPPSSLSSSIITFSLMQNCVSPTAAAYSTTALTTTAFTITSILLLLPLCILVLYLGSRRWRQQRSSMTISHSDIFTYHMVVTELLSILGSSLISCGVHTDLPQMIKVGLYLCNMNLYGQMSFHVLTCVERYLAVVHPVTYLKLTKAKGIRIRNISIGFVWLQCFVWLVFTSVAHQASFKILFYGLQAFAFIVTSLCSIAVLRVLIHPGPGEAGGGRRRVDQTKLRAFCTIMAILGVLLIRIGGSVLSFALLTSPHLGESEKCGVFLSLFWFCLPSSLVLPLLFLQRAGKLLCCKKNK